VVSFNKVSPLKKEGKTRSHRAKKQSKRTKMEEEETEIAAGNNCDGFSGNIDSNSKRG
jgi:hypothetical protein